MANKTTRCTLASRVRSQAYFLRKLEARATNLAKKFLSLAPTFICAESLGLPDRPTMLLGAVRGLRFKASRLLFVTRTPSLKCAIPCMCKLWNGSYRKQIMPSSLRYEGRTQRDLREGTENGRQLVFDGLGVRGVGVERG